MFLQFYNDDRQIWPLWPSISPLMPEHWAGRGNRLALGAELLGHNEPGVAGRIQVEAAERLVALAQVEAGRLEMHREQHRPGAAAPRPFLFRHLDQPAAETPLAQALGQEKAIDEEEPHRRPPDQAADDLAT